MHELLLSAYGAQHWWPAQSAFEMILGAYLTQNTSWMAVEKTLENLRQAELLSLAGIRRVSLRRLQHLIRPSGFYTRKASALKAFVSFLDEHCEGSLEIMAQIPTMQLRPLLLKLPGVGRETADAMLLYAFGNPVPVVDEYLRRMLSRHHIMHPAPGHDKNSYEAMAGVVRKAFATDPESAQVSLFNEFHALVVAVGKAHCSRQPNCAGCPLAADLQYANPKGAEQWQS